jgi:hypothetical protein
VLFDYTGSHVSSVHDFGNGGGDGGHVEGCPAMEDPPHGITDVGPVLEPCNMKV